MLPFGEQQLLHSEHTAVLDREEILDRLFVMRQQEQTSYVCADYLADEKSYEEEQDAVKQPCGDGERKKGGLDAFCREQIVEWSFRVADYFRINRECVAVSVSYLDRFLSTCRCDRPTFKLAATTCLYMSVKLNESHTVKPDMLTVLSDLSRGEFNTEHIIDMEKILLESLAWLMHPPTASCFVGHILTLLAGFTSPALIRSISALASFFTELSLADYYFATEYPSTVALAAILNAIEILNFEDFSENDSSTENFFQELASITETSHTSTAVIEARKRLWAVYERSEEYALHDKPHDVARGVARKIAISSRCKSSNNNVSPVCVSRKI